MLAFGVCVPQLCSSAGRKFAASRSCLQYYRRIVSFPRQKFDEMRSKLDATKNPRSIEKYPTPPSSPLSENSIVVFDNFCATGWRRPIGCLIFTGYFPQKSPIISGWFAKSKLQLKASYGSLSPCIMLYVIDVLLQCVAVCCSVLQCIAVCCSVLQCVAVCCSVLQCVAVCCSVLQCVAVCCSVLQCAVVLRCAAVCCNRRTT